LRYRIRRFEVALRVILLLAEDWHGSLWAMAAPLVPLQHDSTILVRQCLPDTELRLRMR
jgi:hypothetical protein